MSSRHRRLFSLALLCETVVTISRLTPIVLWQRGEREDVKRKSVRIRPEVWAFRWSLKLRNNVIAQLRLCTRSTGHRGAAERVVQVKSAFFLLFLPWNINQQRLIRFPLNFYRDRQYSAGFSFLFFPSSACDSPLILHTSSTCTSRSHVHVWKGASALEPRFPLCTQL